MRRVLVLSAVTFLVATLVPMAVAREEGDEVVLRIGLTQDWETLNPTSGFLVSEYEIWNIHYASLTSLAADDFAVEPALAESWEASDDGLTYTYTLREGLTWSDGEPITAEDIAWNVNTGRDQGWDNTYSTVLNLDAVVIDDRTVEITSSVPDPKLPGLSLYIMPKHVWEPIATDYDATTQHDPGGDVPGSGPFVVTEFNKGQSVVMEANENFYGWEGEEPPYDGIVFRLFENPDAMVAALQQGQLDAIQGFPASSADALEAAEDIEVVAGHQGGFYELAINGGAIEGQPHPALLDIEVRRAIGHAIDYEAMIEDLWFGYAEFIPTISPSADPKWMADIPDEDQFGYDLEEANQILDDAGYMDTDGDGVREMPDGSGPIVLRHAVNTDEDFGDAVGNLFQGWMADIGIDVQLDSYDQDALFGVIVEGTYDTFYWGWTPFVDPDPMLSYFTEAELYNYNDANWFDPEFDALYAEQNQELDEGRRIEIVQEMLTILHDAAVYFPLHATPDLQAYRTDTFTGWVRQPTDIGPVMFSNSSPSYVLLRPVGGEGGGGGDVNWILIGGIAAVVVVGGVLLATRRRGTADERE